MATQEEWKLLLRRSFGVPDLIGDTVGSQTLRARIGDRIERDLRRTEYDTDAGWQDSIANVIAKICEFGEAGKLDAFLAGLEDHNLEQESVVIGSEAWPHGRLSTEVAFARRILEHVQCFVGAHPFVASCGCSFGAPSPESEIAASEPTSG
jgi:hypothetical protein